MSDEKDNLKEPSSSTKDVEAASPTTALNPSEDGAANSKSDTKNAAEAGPSKKLHKGSVSIQEPPVSDTRGYKGYQIVKIEDKHGPLHRAIPVMPLPLAVFCCFLNLLLPGVGKCLFLT